MDLTAFGLAGERVAQEADELPAGVPGAVMPRTLPEAVFSAGNRLTVPSRSYSKPWLLGTAGASCNIRSLRSSAWIAVFSSTQKPAV